MLIWNGTLGLYPPEEGNSPSVREKTHSVSSATQNDGMDEKNWEIGVSHRSSRDPGRWPTMMPSEVPTSQATRVETPTRNSVHGNAPRISSSTGTG